MDPHVPAAAPSRVALLGLGTVGRAVAAHLLDAEWRAGVAARGIVAPTLAAVGVRDPGRNRGLDLPGSVRRTDDLAALVVDPDVDIVIEVIGGDGAVAELMLRAMSAGKGVVTANKALLAGRGAELEGAARAAGAPLRFEAAVGGGVPVLGPLVRDLASDRIDAVRGIVNGTTNHILSAMAEDGRDYEDVLREAQSRGYAEADPSADVEAHDAAQKLALLVRLAFGTWPNVAELRRSAPATQGDASPGITAVSRRELGRAADLGLTIKLVARAERAHDGSLRAGATPVAVRATSPLGATSGVTNLVEVIADPVGRVAFRGPGAGGPAAASAILADVLAIVRGEGSSWGPLPPPEQRLAVSDDVEADRAWFFVADDLVGGHIPASISDLALVAADEAIVTRPMPLGLLRARLADQGLAVTLYPVIPEA